MESRTKPKTLTVVAAILVFAFAITHVILAYQSLTAAPEPGEFGALKNAATGIFGILIMIISILLILGAFFLFKRKRWAYFLTIILMVLSMPVLGVSDVETFVFEPSPGSLISLTSEIFPVIILIILILCLKDFKKVKTV